MGLLLSGVNVTQAGSLWEYNISVYVPTYGQSSGDNYY